MSAAFIAGCCFGLLSLIYFAINVAILKRLGVHIFSIGVEWFGWLLCSFKINQITFKLGMIPLGASMMFANDFAESDNDYPDLPKEAFLSSKPMHLRIAYVVLSPALFIATALLVIPYAKGWLLLEHLLAYLMFIETSEGFVAAWQELATTGSLLAPVIAISAMFSAFSSLPMGITHFIEALSLAKSPKVASSLAHTITIVVLVCIIGILIRTGWLFTHLGSWSWLLSNLGLLMLGVAASLTLLYLAFLPFGTDRKFLPPKPSKQTAAS